MATVRIPLNHDKYALIDEEDYPLVSQCRWYAHKSGQTWYARTASHGYTQMHRLIINAPKGSIVDHCDRNGLNNTRHNLRFATSTQNSANSTIRPSVSGFRGVKRAQRSSGWVAQISIGGTKCYLGTFDTAEIAARAYDAKARAAFGEFSVLNFPDDRNDPPSTRATDDWTEEEDRALIAESEKGGFWRKSASELLGRSEQGCAMRMVRLRKQLDEKRRYGR